MDNQNLYPGFTPYSENDAWRFTGRTTETKEVFHLLMNRKVVILHGESGVGKSSLINAGVRPHFLKYLDEENIVNLYLNPKDPHQSFIKDLTILEKKIETQRTLVIVDQFEQINSINIEDRINIYRRLSSFIQKGTNSQNDNLRIVFAIRSDYLHILEEFSEYYYTIYDYRFKLKGLNKEGAKEAIDLPQTTNRYSISPKLKFAILESCDIGEDHFDTFMLQFLCSKIEHMVDERKLKPKTTIGITGEMNATSVINTKNGRINETQLLSKYYSEILGTLSLIERYSANNEILLNLANYGFKVPILEKTIDISTKAKKTLINNRIFNRVNNSHSLENDMIELAHDKLIPVIQSYSRSLIPTLFRLRKYFAFFGVILLGSLTLMFLFRDYVAQQEKINDEKIAHKTSKAQHNANLNIIQKTYHSHPYDVVSFIDEGKDPLLDSSSIELKLARNLCNNFPSKKITYYDFNPRLSRQIKTNEAKLLANSNGINIYIKDTLNQKHTDTLFINRTTNLPATLHSSTIFNVNESQWDTTMRWIHKTQVFHDKYVFSISRNKLYKWEVNSFDPKLIPSTELINYQADIWKIEYLDNNHLIIEIAGPKRNSILKIFKIDQNGNLTLTGKHVVLPPDNKFLEINSTKNTCRILSRNKRNRKISLIKTSKNEILQGNTYQTKYLSPYNSVSNRYINDETHFTYLEKDSSYLVYSDRDKEILKLLSHKKENRLISKTYRSVKSLDALNSELFLATYLDGNIQIWHESGIKIHEFLGLNESEILNTTTTTEQATITTDQGIIIFSNTSNISFIDSMEIKKEKIADSLFVLKSKTDSAFNKKVPRSGSRNWIHDSHIYFDSSNYWVADEQYLRNYNLEKRQPAAINDYFKYQSEENWTFIKSYPEINRVICAGDKDLLSIFNTSGTIVLPRVIDLRRHMYNTRMANADLINWNNKSVIFAGNTVFQKDKNESRVFVYFTPDPDIVGPGQEQLIFKTSYNSEIRFVKLKKSKEENLVILEVTFQNNLTLKVPLEVTD